MKYLSRIKVILPLFELGVTFRLKGFGWIPF